MSVAAVRAADTTQRPIPDPNTSPVTLLEASLLTSLKSSHDNRPNAANSSTADIAAAALVDVDFV